MEHQPALALDVIEKTQISPYFVSLFAPEDMAARVAAAAIAAGFRCADVINFRRHSGGTMLTQTSGWVEVRIPFHIDQLDNIEPMVEEIMGQPRPGFVCGPILEKLMGSRHTRYTIKR